jgi:agmatinase
MISPRFVTRGALLTLSSAWLLLSVESAFGQWPIPAELQSRASVLTTEQLAFITSGAILKFIPERQLEHELATRDADGLRSLMDDLMSLADEMGYDPQKDMGAAPLNLTSKNFNEAMPTPAPLRDLKREPGPFSVHRYQFPKSGVPTFGGAPVAIFPEDLVAGKVDVAIVGVPANMSSGRRDAGNGPDAMRGLNTVAMPDVQSLVKPFEALSVVDYGNFAVDGLSTERTVNHVAAMVAETAGTGAIPMLVGGDTSMLYPGVSGVARVHGKGSFGLLHFSAHPDAERRSDHTISDRQALFALLEEGIVEGSETVQVGLRGPAVDTDTLQWLRDKSVRYHTMAEFRERGPESVMDRVLQEVASGPETYFVSVDVSVVKPAELFGAGRATYDGLRIEVVTQAIRHVCAAKKIVGFEITDVAPMLDYSLLSITQANAVLNACLVGIAVRKEGLAPDYVHPLALDHGQR